jgi:hypothetical protein
MDQPSKPLNMFTYFLSASVYLTLFYIVYQVAFHRMTFFSWNRALILAGLAFTLLAPLVPADVVWHTQPPKAIGNFTFLRVQSFLVGGNDTKAGHGTPMGTLTPWSVLKWVYLAGVGVMLLRCCLGIYRLKRLIGSGAREGKGIIGTPDTNASFFRWIFLQSNLDGSARETVLLHERYHARRWHSMDNLLMEGLSILFWFHPLMYRFRRLLQETHEWETDAYMREQMDPKAYAHLLLGLNTGTNPRLCHGYSASSMAKRMHVLFQKPTIAMKKAMYLLVIPCLAAAMALVSPFATKAQAQIQTVTIVGSLPSKGVFFRQTADEDIMVVSFKKMLGNGDLDDQLMHYRNFLEKGMGEVGPSFQKDHWEFTTSEYVDSLHGNQLNIGFGLTPWARMKEFKDGPMTGATYRVNDVIDAQRLVVCTVNKQTGHPRVVSMTPANIREAFGFDVPVDF